VRDRTPEAWRRGIADARAGRAELAGRGLQVAARYRWPAVAEHTREVLLEAAAR
jgi:hypothetical protein